ncbi:MAG: TonB-dependent siderophore receptor [Pseudomonadota bacterium]
MALLVTFSVGADDGPTRIDNITVSAEALKIETPAQDTPRSVSIVTREDLDAMAPKKLDEALRYTAGVTSQPFGADNDTDWIRIRGFEAATYLDGSRLFRDGFYTWLVEPYGLQQIEVVKGPSAILFGESAPGGIVNAVQKKPTDEPQGEVLAEVGDKGLFSLGFDTSDALNESDSTSYRLVGLVKGHEGELDQTENDRVYLAPSLKVDFSDETTLTLLATVLEDDGIPTNGFFPAAGTLIDSDFGEIDPSTNYGEPDYDVYERTQISVGYQLDHTLNDVWRFSQNLNYGQNELLLRSVYAFFNDDPSASDLFRGVVFRDGENQSITFDNHVVGKWESSGSKHTLLFGADLQQHETDGEEQDNFAFGTINVADPVYGNFTPLDPANNIDREIKKSQSSVYSQYQIEIDEKWIALAGARFDKVKTENISVIAAQDQSRDDDEVSLNAGFIYLADNGLSPYISYSESFEVFSTIDFATGELYKPLDGEQLEIGIKYEPETLDGYINLAWFDITEKNALVTDPNTFIATQTGEETSTGIELEFVGQVSESVKLSAAYAYVDAETDDTGDQGKKQAGLIPEQTVTAWVDYDASFAGVEGLMVGAGVRYIGESKDNPASSDRTVPSTSLLDAMISYDINEQWGAQLNVNNLLDEEYISGCDYWCYYGESRSIILSTKYRW